MDVIVKNLLETWQTISQEIIRLNESANDMIKLQKDLAIFPYLLDELMDDPDESPLAIIAAMKRDQAKLDEQLFNLNTAIESAHLLFADSPELTELENLKHNTEVMRQFLNKIAISEIEESLKNLAGGLL
ncbi:hypothetical protein [Calothrix sp. NIES-2098]|uniref:hypothetical protein n=1 Tax=Calothrix sp. NIES-2098 TaxID=1954171 RepID=UPI000B5EF626|nr:hypothetical protein NIES2098_20680 [Calothrix sp. NIES-2098]